MYLYYNSQGVLLEFINDKALRQYSASSYNTIYVYIDNGNNDGKISESIVGLSYWFERISGTPIASGDIIPPNTDNEMGTSVTGGSIIGTIEGKIPFNRNRDLKYFAYGKTYQFFELTVPRGVLEDRGVYGMSCQTLIKENGNNIPDMMLGLCEFTVEKSAIMPYKEINTSQYQYLLANTRKGSVIFYGKGLQSGELFEVAPEILADDTDDFQHLVTRLGAVEVGEPNYEAYVGDMQIPRNGDLFLYQFDYPNGLGQDLALCIIWEIISVEPIEIDGETTSQVELSMQPICYINDTATVLGGRVVTTAPQDFSASEQEQVWINLGLANGDIVEY